MKRTLPVGTISAVVCLLLSSTSVLHAQVVDSDDIVVTYAEGHEKYTDAIDPTTGDRTLIFAGGFTSSGHALKFDTNGDLIARGGINIYRFNTETVTESLVSSGGLIGGPESLAIAPNGDIFTTSQGNWWTDGFVIKVDPGTGEQTLITSGGLLTGGALYGITVTPNGDLYVCGQFQDRAVVKIDPATGAQTLISSGGLFSSPGDLAFDAAGSLIVADAYAGIIRVDPVTGVQTMISSGGLLGPDGAAQLIIAADGKIYCTCPQQHTVLRIDPVTGAQEQVAHFGIYKPFGIATKSSVISADSDGDGLSDANEIALGTDRDDPDTDDDGLLDGTEVDIADGSDCPDPLDPDSDGDGLLDGAEVALGTSPCEVDTDDDGIWDDEDPTPTTPGVPSSFIEAELRPLATDIDVLPLTAFSGNNANAAAGRRNALSNKITAAANLVAVGDIDDALVQLYSLLDKIDGNPQPPDWMPDSTEKDELAEEVRLMIELLELL